MILQFLSLKKYVGKDTLVLCNLGIYCSKKNQLKVFFSFHGFYGNMTGCEIFLMNFFLVHFLKKKTNLRSNLFDISFLVFYIIQSYYNELF